MHDRDTAGYVRMRVTLRRHAVRRPARVGNAEPAIDTLRLGEFLEFHNPPRAAHALQRAVQHRYPGGVVAAVLQALQALDQYGRNIAPGNGPYNPAHGCKTALDGRLPVADIRRARMISARIAFNLIFTSFSPDASSPVSRPGTFR